MIFTGKREESLLSPKKKTTYFRKWLIFCDLGGARTLDPLIKSQLLYQLSYRNVTHSVLIPVCGHKNTINIRLPQQKNHFFSFH